jgi:hypothetical protein
MAQIRARAREAGLGVHELDMLRDLDRRQDLARWPRGGAAMTARSERRRLLGVGALGCAAALLQRAVHAAPPLGATVPLQAPVPMARLHVDGDGTLFGLSTRGELWQLDAAAWRRVGAGLDPAAPLASGHGRVVGRSSDGGLWVLEGGRVFMPRSPTLAPHGGMLVLAFAVIAVAADADGRSHVLRLEAQAGGWRETARSAHEVLPDARPLQFDPGGGASDDNGHVVVFASPDAQRYRHGVLGDAIEPRSILLLERHGLEPMARLELPAPYVFEDIAPRPIAWRGRRALLTVRAGPQGAQLAVVARAGDGSRFELAALGEPIGTRHRWLSPSSDGVLLWAVHTPHLGGVVQRYRSDGDRLVGEVVGHGVSNHAIGERELDLSAWTQRAWVLPTQDRRSLRLFALDSDAGIPRHRDVALAQPVVQLKRWPRQGEDGVAVLLRDGSVLWLPANP